MTKKMKRSIALCAAATFGMALLAGCSKEEDSAPPPPTANGGGGGGVRSQVGPASAPATPAPGGGAPAAPAPAGGGGVAGAAVPN